VPVESCVATVLSCRRIQFSGKGICARDSVQRWATTVLVQAMSSLGKERLESGRDELFRHVEGLPAGEKGEAPYAEIAATLKLNDGAMKVALHRLRQR
jgi:hypothetical protein